MSLWGDYVKEKYNKYMIEDENGFLIYYLIPQNKELYVEDIYIVPEHRKLGAYKTFLKKLEPIFCQNECEKLSCSVFLYSNKPEESIAWILKLGFKISHITDNKIIYFICNKEDYYNHEH